MILFGSGATAQAAPYDPAYLIVSGNPSPDSTGIYAPIGDYNGDTLYARQSNSAFYIGAPRSLFIRVSGLFRQCRQQILDEQPMVDS